MAALEGSVSIAILTLLTFISFLLAAYLVIYCYTQFVVKQKRNIQSNDSHWLNYDRKPLIPGSFHAETVQPLLSNSGEPQEEEGEGRSNARKYMELETFKERDYSRLGRIIFVMRYHKKREELMVRLVQIEGMPVSQNLYSPNSAYVDVQLKYTGQPGESDIQHPPRLDICLQQVYYFTISMQQMMSHSLEFQVNTFDDQFRRFVSGLVDVDLCEEMGNDIWTGSEVVFVKEIMDPFRNSSNDDDSLEDFASVASDVEIEKDIGDDNDDDQEWKMSRSQSRASSNMSWEPESKELLTLSTSSLYFRCTSEQDIKLNPLTDFKRSHSIGYLATNEWTIKDIPLVNDQKASHTPEENIGGDEVPLKRPPTLKIDSYSESVDACSCTQGSSFRKPPPESFYHIVPVTPLYAKDLNSKSDHEKSVRRVAFKKHPKRKQLGHSLTVKVSNPKRLSILPKNSLERSSSWPSLKVNDLESSADVTPEHKREHSVIDRRKPTVTRLPKSESSESPYS